MDLQNKKTWEDSRIVRFYENRKDRNSIALAEERIFSKIDDLNKLAMLDLGIGAGRTTAVFHDKVAYYFGSDYSEQMVESCRKRFRNVENIQLDVVDASDLSRFKDSSFDIVLFSLCGIDYIDSPEIRNKCLTEAYRVLRQGGHYVFSTHNFHKIRRYYSFPEFKTNMIFFKELVKNSLIPFFNGPYKKIKDKDAVIFNDGSLRFGLNTFYIKPEYQIKTLKEMNFKDIEVYDLSGTQFRDNFEDTGHDYFLYYYCRKY